MISPRDYVNNCFLSLKGMKCNLNFQIIDVEKGNPEYNFVILGEIFMKNYVVVFDQENDLIGMALNINSQYFDKQ